MEKTALHRDAVNLGAAVELYDCAALAVYILEMYKLGMIGCQLYLNEFIFDCKFLLAAETVYIELGIIA